MWAEWGSVQMFAATRWIRHENKSALINEELSVQSEIQTTHVRQTTQKNATTPWPSV